MKLNDKPMIIYLIQLKEEIVYIGQTKLSLLKRRTQHEYNAKRGKGFVIGAGLRKHGPENFKWLVHSVHYNQIDLDAAEKYYIKKYKPKYNINLGGESRGTRKNKGTIPWNKGLKGQKAWNKGLKETRPDVLTKIRNSAQKRDNSDRKISKEHREALVKGRRAKYAATNKPFICHQNSKTYVLVVDAAKDLNIKATGIYAVLNQQHRLKSYEGFTFSYL